jgi:hypothetical protein
MLCLKSVQTRHQPFGGKRRRTADSQADLGIDIAQPVDRIGNLIETVAQSRQTGLSGMGQQQRPVEAAKELHAEMIFEEFDLAADRRGGDV